MGIRVAPNVYLTFGNSVRLVSVPTSYAIGDLVAVPLSASGSATPPSFATRDSVVFQFDVGLAIDVGGAAAAVSSLVGSFGGGK
jgi:hypothetical protein